jgi:hypothetical protein
MHSVTYQLETSELDERFIKSIKALFGEGRVKVTITPEEKEITNPVLLSSLSTVNETTTAYDISADEFQALADKVLTDESFDAIAAIKQFKINR